MCSLFNDLPSREREIERDQKYLIANLFTIFWEHRSEHCINNLPSREREKKSEGEWNSKPAQIFW